MLNIVSYIYIASIVAITFVKRNLNNPDTDVKNELVLSVNVVSAS